ncbi:MAG: flagellar hook-associated protein FlgK [Agathobacter sp.]|nr:flagellar hook-associated protein FlgK [Agathobacter sp.]
MPSQFFGLNIAASGLSAFQASVNTTANNIANVQTQGYTRQTTNLESSDPLRVYTRYGSTGTGVSAVSITQERNLYYDTKYWENSSSAGFFSQKIYYLDQIQEVLRDDSTQDGFTTIFSKMFNGLDTLKTNGADESVRNQFIHQAQSLCTYFNALSQNLTELQEDCNEEIKSTVSNINSISQKVAMLNKEINMIEVRGGHANELRDQRANLIDELSSIVSVETQEFVVHNSNGQDLGGTNYRVMINGQMLVDGNDYRTLECVSSEYKQNLSDADGMYSIVWEDTKMDFAATTGTAGGSLKALFSVRDGNNKENLKGTISEVSADGMQITIKNPTVTDPNALNIPANGQVTLGGKHYTYESWSAEVGEDGITSFTFTLSEALEGDPAAYANKTLSCGNSVDAMGVPYYQAQINEFIRNFTQAFNDIEKKGVDLNGSPMGSFFVGESVTGTIYDVDEYDAAIAAARAAQEAGGTYQYTLTSEMDSYYKVTASTVEVNARSLQDPTYFSTATEIINGQDKFDIAEELLTLQKGVKMFRGDSAESFLETLLSDITVDVNKTEIYSNNYTNLCNTINNQRISVSGVDEDEEAVNLVKFQNAYNLASKVISVMSEIYNKLINETGVT